MLHLFHPALVHFAVAFLVAGGLIEAVALLAERREAARLGGWLVVLGTIALVPVIASGYVASNTTELTAGARPILTDHERNGWILLAVFVTAQLWKGWNGGRVPPAHRYYYAALLLAGVLLAAFNAYLGGRLVYGHGVGVGPL